jgi:hypothetical protein
MQLYNSHFNGWETQLPGEVDHEIAANNLHGFNCKIPFIKLDHQNQIAMQFVCKINVGLHVSIAEMNMQQMICVEKEYNAGLQNLMIDLSAMNLDTMYLLCIKSIGQFQMQSIELV